MASLQLSEVEFHTILAALRFYQRLGQGDPDNRAEAIQDLATNSGNSSSLDANGIDQLCEKINFSFPNESERLKGPTWHVSSP